ncbi:hypothetical protein [Natronococcus amylolyticus]|uniref:hypothetical protein n=1 Tax=Natronococcus amylolyticus TaxID=44470 RepID=UPI000A05AB9B|nr:hypothetical protein [Natronococcus amylolyticus]
MFIEWGTELEDLAAKLSTGEYEERNRFRSSIMRSIHGLAGSIIHLFDALEIDVVRELRVPAGLDTNSLNELATSVGIATAIQSKYGAFACYRHCSRHEERSVRVFSRQQSIPTVLKTISTDSVPNSSKRSKRQQRSLRPLPSSWSTSLNGQPDSPCRSCDANPPVQ